MEKQTIEFHKPSSNSYIIPSIFSNTRRWSRLMLSSLSSVCLPVSYSYFFYFSIWQISFSISLFMFCVCRWISFLSRVRTVTIFYFIYSFNINFQPMDKKLSAPGEDDRWRRCFCIILRSSGSNFSFSIFFSFSNDRCLRWCPPGEDPVQQKGYGPYSNGRTASSPTWWF